MLAYGSPSRRPELPPLTAGEHSFDFDRAFYLMGVLNVTPDSFSDGGEHFDPAAATARGAELVEKGADMIDVGGESTRPGAQPVPMREELDRVIPVVSRLADRVNVPISIDTYKASVAARALEAGADLVNDISGLRFDDDMASTVAQADVPVIVMHIRGTPRNMQKHTDYDDVIDELHSYFRTRIDAAVEAGIDADQIIIDPGIGFGKTTGQNYRILRELSAFCDLDSPILIGPSRKSLIGDVLDTPPKQRIWGTAATVACGLYNGANIVRVHDVEAMNDVLKVTEAIAGKKSFDSQTD